MGLLPWFRISVLFIIVQCTLSADDSQRLSKTYLDGIINHVNSVGAHWEAGHNFEDIDDDMVQHLVGTEHEHPEGNDLPALEHLYDHPPFQKLTPPSMGLDSFDGLKQWSHCPSVKKIRNQGKCASDWAATPVDVITDRLCIATNGTKKVQLSSHEPLSCCKSCGWGCRKGFPQMVYKHFVTKGLATGGDYNSKQGCQPYEIKPCKGNFKNCFMKSNYPTPKCKPYCYNSNYKKKYTEDKFKGAEAYRLMCPCCSVLDIAKYGPATATMKVYEDFLTYKNGIYHHVTGKALGFLTVKLVGFNDTNKPHYWVATNSWGTKWGDKGVFKIRRFTDECMIEGSIRSTRIYKSESSEETD